MPASQAEQAWVGLVFDILTNIVSIDWLLSRRRRFANCVFEAIHGIFGPPTLVDFQGATTLIAQDRVELGLLESNSVPEFTHGHTPRSPAQRRRPQP